MTRRHLDAGLDLLDRHVVDRDGTSVGKVDDLELHIRDDGPPRVVALLLGPQAQGRRVGGVVGRWMVGVGSRLSGRDEPYRIPVALVDEFGVSVRLKVAAGELPQAGRLERWLRDHVVDRIPGGRRASG